MYNRGTVQKVRENGPFWIALILQQCILKRDKPQKKVLVTVIVLQLAPLTLTKQPIPISDQK
jgi:hypothetical protein